MCGFKEFNLEDIDNTCHIIHKNKKFNKALDVGSEIGRVTFNILFELCNYIDTLYINNKFLEIAERTQLEKLKISIIMNYKNLSSKKTII